MNCRFYWRKLPWGPTLECQWMPTIRRGGRYGKWWRQMLLIRWNCFRIDVLAYPTRWPPKWDR